MLSKADLGAAAPNGRYTRSGAPSETSGVVPKLFAAGHRASAGINVDPISEISDHPPRILIVDDQLRNRKLLEVMLAPEGFHILTATNGAEALSIVAEQLPDLMLLDIRMPGIDGYQVARMIKADPAARNIPIIMVSAVGDREARMLALDVGVEEFLTKPVDRAELCARVTNLLRLKAYGEQYNRYTDALEGEVVSRTADLVTRTTSLERQAAVLADQAALLDLAQDAIVVRDMHGLISFWSRGAEILYGWLGQDARGRRADDLLKTVFSEPRDHIDAMLLRQGRWDGEVTHHTRDGTRVVVASRWALQCDADGTAVRILSIDSDITCHKQAEADLLSLTERLSLATAVAKVGVWEWDLASNALTGDATMFDIYGCPPVIPLPYDAWSAAVCPEDLPAVEAALWKTVADKGQGSAEYRIRLPDRAIRYICAAERTVLDESGRVTRVIGVDMDVTERKQAESALETIRTDQLRFKDEFLSHVSHELRSPLTAIKQFSSILSGGLAGELNAEQRGYQQIVLKNVRQLQSMIDDLFEVTRLESGKLPIALERVSVTDAVSDTFDTFRCTARVKDIMLSSHLAPDLPAVYADYSRLRQILIILLDNAIKFTPEGGAVTIRARSLPDDPSLLLLEVSDTGCGISPEIAAKVFDRLYQAQGAAPSSRKGLGLGLYICRELVTRQGGQIWVNPHSQNGSVFSLTLPVYVGQPPVGSGVGVDAPSIHPPLPGLAS